MLLAQISDLHFLPQGTLAFGRVDAAGCLERAIDHLNALRPAADAVLITGDLTNDGDAPVWAELIGRLGRLRAPILAVPGNHDDRELMRQAFAGRGPFPARGPGAPVHVFVHGGYWQRLDKSDSSFVARGLQPSGVAVVVINYALIPTVDMDELVRQCRASIVWVHKNAPVRLVSTTACHCS